MTPALLTRKLRQVFDATHTWLRLRELEVPLRAPLTRVERMFYFQLRPVLVGKELVVYDIGASSGNYTCMLAKLSNVSQVYAFEPIPEVFGRLQKRVRRFDNVRCFPVALGDTNGSASLHQSDFTHSSSLLPMAELHKTEFPHTAHTVERPVTLARLDDFAAQHDLLPPDVLKIDVQGFEDRVLAGAPAALRHARYCVLEMSLQPLYEGSLLFEAVYDLMRSHGFRLCGFADQLTTEDSTRVLQVDGLFGKNGG